MVTMAIAIGLVSLALMVASLFVGQFKELTQFRAHMTMAFLAQKKDAGTIKVASQGFEPLDHKMSERELAERSGQLIGHLANLQFGNLYANFAEAEAAARLARAETVEMPSVKVATEKGVNFVMLPPIPVAVIELSVDEIEVMYLAPSKSEIGFTRDQSQVSAYKALEVYPDTLLDMGVRLNVGGTVRRKL
jgi:hypothetical protein